MPTSRAGSSTCSTAEFSRSGAAPPEQRQGASFLERTVTMWRNYWTVAVRALAKSRTYSIINIAGLAIGMAACILILLYIRYERSYDAWIPDVENTYELQSWYPNPKDGVPGFFQMGTYVAQ